MFKLNRNTSRIIVIVLLGIISIYWLYSLNESYEAYNDLMKEYNDLVNKYNELAESYNTFQNEVLSRVEENHTAVTIM